MDRRSPSPDRDRQKLIEKSSSDASPKKITLEQHMRILGLNPHKSSDQKVGLNETTSSGLDKRSARQTEDCSSACKEILALPNVWDKGKRLLSPEEERWLKSIPIGENGQRAPRVDLSTTFTPDHLILVGGMMGETSRRDDLAGENFDGPRYGGYRCGRRLGGGAFGEVYLAKHGASNEIVAIKVLRENRLKKEFGREATILKSITNPNIVRFRGYGEKRGVYYLAMEYARYGTLRDAHPRNQRLSPKQVYRYVDQIANALDCMHNCLYDIKKGRDKARSLMHLDLKPENILLGEGPNGEKKILLADLGLAQEVHNPESQPPYWAGTPAYMAPEQQEGRPCPQSDQYTLAVMAYEWLNGSRPGPNPRKIPEISDGINDVVLKALNNDPKERYQDVKAFAEAFMDAYVKYEKECENRVHQDKINDLEREKQVHQGKINDLERENQVLRNQHHQEKKDLEKTIQELMQRLALLEKDHEASTSRTSPLEKGKASSSSTGREGTKSHAEQQPKEKQIDKLIDSETRQKAIKKFYDSGEKHRLAGRYNEALDDYSQVLALERNHAFALESRGAVKLRLKDYQGALQDLDKSLEIEPNSAFALGRRGAVKFMLKDYQGALQDLDKSLEIEPNSAFALERRGAVKLELKDYQGALQDLDKSLEIEPNSALALVTRGQVYQAQGNDKEALADFDHALALDSSLHWVKVARDNVRERMNWKWW